MLAGDQINQIDGQPTRSWKDVRRALRFATANQTIAVDVARNGSVVNLSTHLSRMTAIRFENYLVVDSNPASEAHLTEIQIPEVPNQCFAMIPLTEKPKGVLVWLNEPGKQNQDLLEKIWRKDSVARNTIVLFPQSRNPTQWQAEDADFIVKAVDVVAQRYEIDSNLIAIGGVQTAGVMAAITAFDQRDLFGGLICVDCVLPEKLQEQTTDPEQRVLVLFVHSETFANGEMLQKSLQRLEAQKFPTHSEPTGNFSIESWTDKILGWVDSLDRL